MSLFFRTRLTRTTRRRCKWRRTLESSWQCPSSFSWFLNSFHSCFNTVFKVHKGKGRTLFMFSPPKISWAVSGTKYICLHSIPVFYLIQPSGKQIICFDFRKQNSVLPIVFYVPCVYTFTPRKRVIKESRGSISTHNFFEASIILWGSWGSSKK